MERECEKYNKSAEGQTQVEPSGGEIVKPTPPPKMPLLDDELEYVADDSP